LLIETQFWDQNYRIWIEISRLEPEGGLHAEEVTDAPHLNLSLGARDIATDGK
jgi:hypothetical protein